MTTRADSVTATRDRIVKVASEMFLAHAFEDVTLNAIASAAGVSHQTVLNHFGSKEGVAVAVGETLRQAKNAARASVTPGDVPGVVHALVSEYERIGGAQVRWGATWERLGTIGEMMLEVRASHQRWLEGIFAADLPSEPVERERTLHALHVATDAYTWRLLSRDLGLPLDETEAVMARLVTAALAGAPEAAGTA